MEPANPLGGGFQAQWQYEHRKTTGSGREERPGSQVWECALAVGSL
ncbi:MAG: hypothetical protein R2751_13935 [Bacteroidales bacterium]